MRQDACCAEQRSEKADDAGDEDEEGCEKSRHAVKAGVAAARLRPIPIKKHGRRAWSLFALGVATLHKITASAKPDQIIVFLRQLMSSKLPVNELKSMAL